MKKDDKILDKLSLEKVKQLGLDEPSADFTLKVMQVIAEEQPIYLKKQKNYWWMLSLLPIFAGICWYLLAVFELTGYVYNFWTLMRDFAQPIGNAISSLFIQIKDINIPPLFIVGFVAILSLLTIEEIVNRIKQKHTIF